MTGKEDKPFKITYSKEAKEMIERENLGRIMEIIEDDFVTKVCESIYLQQIDELTQCKITLAKYKRAFEILKDTVDFNIFCREVKKGDGVEKTYFIIFGEIWVRITKEEYELLEELMKSER